MVLAAGRLAQNVCFAVWISPPGFINNWAGDAEGRTEDALPVYTKTDPKMMPSMWPFT